MIGSSTWTINKMTDIVIIKGITASFVPSPAAIKSEQMTSAKTVSIKEAVDPSPIGSEKFKSPEISFPNLGIPWVSISIAIPNLKINKERFIILL